MGNNPEISFAIEQAFRQLEADKVTPWAFFSTGKMKPVEDFYGRTIHYSGVSFEGSPRLVFWRFIQPFLEARFVWAFDMALSHAGRRGTDRVEAVDTARQSLSNGIDSVFQRMQDIDRRLRGHGFPERVTPRDISDEIRQMHVKLETYYESAKEAIQRRAAASDLQPGIQEAQMVPTAFIHHACELIGDTTTGLTGPKIVEYCNRYAVDYNVDISYSEYPFPNSIPNKRTALYRNLQVFSPEQRIQILDDLCRLPQFDNNLSIKTLHYQILSKYGHLINMPVAIDAAIVEETRHWLKDFPDSFKLYNDALVKLNNNVFARNLLDDLRLSLEKLVKSLLNNDKPLEKQLSDLGNFLKTRGCASELRNMFVTLIDYYTKYQNTYVKHDDAVSEKDIHFVFEMTTVFMRSIIRVR